MRAEAIFRRPGFAAVLSDYFIVVFIVVLFAALAPVAPGLASAGTFQNILAYMVPLFLAATGLTIVLITGGIDLSIPAVIALSSVVGANIMTGQEGGARVVPGVGAMLVIGAGVGALNGALITVPRLPAFIVTLASMLFFNGFAVWLTQ